MEVRFISTQIHQKAHLGTAGPVQGSTYERRQVSFFHLRHQGQGHFQTQCVIYQRLNCTW